LNLDFYPLLVDLGRSHHTGNSCTFCSNWVILRKIVGEDWVLWSGQFPLTTCLSRAGYWCIRFHGHMFKIDHK
jgi:hypothetical protein